MTGQICTCFRQLWNIWFFKTGFSFHTDYSDLNQSERKLEVFWPSYGCCFKTHATNIFPKCSETAGHACKAPLED